MPSTGRTAIFTVAAVLVAALVLVPDAPPVQAQQASDCSAGALALTFDDGPGPDTGEVPDILAAHDTPATFFVVGQNVDDDRWQQYTPRAAAEGHAVANHTYGHERLTELSDEEISHTIRGADQAIRNVDVEPTTLLRPPYGATDGRVEAVIEAESYTQKLWDIDPRDWDPDRSGEQISSYVLENLHPGAVILLHDWSAPEVGILEWTDEPVITQADASNTIEALPTIIDEAHARGYCFGILNDAGDIVGAEPDPDPEPGPDPDPDPAADLPGVVRDGVWHLRNAHAGGSSDVEFRYGRADDLPVVGDWNGDGSDTPGIIRGRTWHLRNALSGGEGDVRFSYGTADDTAVVWR